MAPPPLYDKQEWEDMLTKDDVIGAATEIDIRKAPTLQRLQVLPFHFGLIPQLQVLNLTRSKIVKFPAGLDHLVNLKELILGWCAGLKTLPDEIGGMSSLTHMDLSYCYHLEALPPSIVRLPSLKHWNLEFCARLKRLPEDIGALKTLEYLNLTNCLSLLEFPISIGRLVNLRKLIATHCYRLQALPEEVGDLQNLEELILGDTDDSEINVPTSIRRLQTLQKLVIQSAANSELPPEIWTLNNVQVLDLSWLDQLRSLPQPVAGCQLASLKELNLTRCQKLSSLPRELEELVQLEKLKLRDSLFVSQITIDFGRLVNLKELELGREIPQERDEDNEMEIVAQPRSFYDTMALQIGRLQQLENFMLVASDPFWESLMEKESLTSLKHLHLAYLRSFTHLPWSKMLDLEELRLEECHALQSLPTEIGQLQNLRKLDIACHALEALPVEIGHLSKLEQLKLSSESLCLQHENELFPALSNLPKSVVSLSMSGWTEAQFMDKFAVTDLPPHLRKLVFSGVMHASSISEQTLISLLRKNPYLCILGKQFLGKKNVDFLLEMNHFRSVLVEEGNTMDICWWPMILEQVNKKLAGQEVRRAAVMYEMFKRTVHYNILSRSTVLRRTNVVEECDDGDEAA